MAYIISPNMTLVVPSVGSEQGPDYAFDINTSLAIIDSHDHSVGSGVKITPAGMNISSALTFNNNPAAHLQYINFDAQTSVSTVQALYVKPGGEATPINDLFYNDGIGNVIQLTKSGTVNATIASLPGESYGGGTFTWKQGAGSVNPADFDIGSITLRPNIAATTFGITLTTPSAIASAFTLVLPALPAASSNPYIMTLDSSGNITAPWQIDNSSLAVTSGILKATAGSPDNVTIQNISGFTSVKNGDREHNWELNGIYSGLTYPVTDLDALFLAPYNITITSVWIYGAIQGTSGTTEHDLKVSTSPGQPYASIFSTTPKMSATTPITSITRVSLTATATLANHGRVNGETVIISGATQPEYNGTYTVINATTNTFDYTFAGSLVSPATGSPVLNTRPNTYTDSNSIVPAQSGVIKAVLSTTNINAGSAIRWDLITSQTGVAKDARIRIYYKQR